MLKLLPLLQLLCCRYNIVFTLASCASLRVGMPVVLQEPRHRATTEAREEADTVPQVMQAGLLSWTVGEPKLIPST